MKCTSSETDPIVRDWRVWPRAAAHPIRFHGWVDNNSPEMERLFGSSDIFVLASEAENFPVSLLEAMSAGLAIVTCSDTGSADVVGNAGLLVSCKDSQELRRAILELIGDRALRTELGKKARKRLEDNFSWTSVTNRHLLLYQQHLPWPRPSVSQRAKRPQVTPKTGEARELRPIAQQAGGQKETLAMDRGQLLSREAYFRLEKSTE